MLLLLQIVMRKYKWNVVKHVRNIALSLKRFENTNRIRNYILQEIMFYLYSCTLFSLNECLQCEYFKSKQIINSSTCSKYEPTILH